MTTFNIYRRESNDTNPPVQIATGLTSMSYSDATAEVGKEYLYSVGAVKSGFEKVSSEKPVFAGGDPYWDKVVALIRFDGSVQNLKGSAVVASNPVFEDGVFNQGIRFTGGSGRYVSFQSNDSSQDFEDKDFTIDFWIKIIAKPSSSNYAGIIGKRNAYSSMSFSAFIVPSSSAVSFELYNNSNQGHGGGFPEIPLNTFKFISIEREGGKLRAYLSGQMVWEQNITGSVRTSSIPITLGRLEYSWSGGYSNCVLDEVRITKGVARYKGIHVVPTEPFPAF